VATLREAAREGDSDRLRRAAHSLKGASGNLGAIVLSSLCGDLERAAGQGGDDVQALVTEIADAYERARQELERQSRVRA
jgi:histidine phosphotransfer protein HptB